MKILILSDTHGHLDDRIIYYTQKVDEIWHAGDIGSIELIDLLKKNVKVNAVYGNIDGKKIFYIITEKNIAPTIQKVANLITENLR